MERKDKMPLDKSINKDRSTDNRGAGQGQSQGGVNQGGLQQDKFRDKNKPAGSTGATGSTTTSTTGRK